MGILVGIYIGIGVCIFFVTGFFAMLGGKETDLWKPFLYAPFWPFSVPFILLKRRFGRR